MVITFQNIGPQTETGNTDKAKHNMAAFRSAKPDVALFAEHDINPAKSLQGHKFHDRQGASIEETTSFITNNSHESARHRSFQWGGTGWTAHPRIKDAIVDRGQDYTKLGRWSWARMKGRDEKYTLSLIHI